MNTVLRVLKVVRLSHSTAESVSIEMQSTRVDAWCVAQGMQVIDTATDVDVSGAISPFERDGLGKWLTDTPPAQYDFIVSYHLSRVSRSALDTMNLVRWLGQRGKNLATVDDGLNTSTTFGKTVITIIAALAEAELEATTIRLLENKDVKRKKGFVVQGSGCWGYNAVSQVIDGVQGKRLVQDPVVGPLVQDVIHRVVHGETVPEVEADLDRQGLSHPVKITQTLRSFTLCGYQVHSTTDDRGRRIPYVVRDKKGNPIMVTDDPLVSRTDFDLLQIALDSAKRPHKKRRQGSALSGVVRCSVCGQLRITANGGRRRSLMCSTKGCAGGSILENVVWDRVEEELRSWRPDDVELFELAATISRRENDDRRDALKAKETELKETMKLNALDRAQWEADGLSDVYQQVQAEHRAEMAMIKAELGKVDTTTKDPFTTIPLGVTLYGEFAKLRASEAAKVDMSFLLDFAAALTVTVGPAERDRRQPGQRVIVESRG